MSVKNTEIIKPQNIEESLIWYTIVGTYGLYIVGAQPIFLPLIAWFLALYLCYKLWEQRTSNTVDRKVIIPFSVWVWIFSMLIILFCVVVSHIDFNLGGVRFIKSLLRWSREHAFWALFPLIGGCLNIRPQLLYRAICILCLQSLILIPICYLAFFLDLPRGPIYTSPLYLLGGNAAELYSVGLYTFDYNINLVRLSLFSPWSPNLALLAIIYFFLASQESNKKWRWVGMIGAIAMMITASSRTALLCFPTVILLTWILTNFSQPIIYFTAGVGSFFMSIFASDISYFLGDFTQKLYTARADSSKIRMTSLRLSLDRWWNEAPIWGHGFTESQGPIIMNSSPVGTSGCGTWVNLLYTEGLVGLIAFAVPFLYSFVALLNKAQKSATARVGLSVLLVFFCFSFTEELEVLAYLYWPGLLIIGIAFKEKVRSAFILMNVKQPLLR